MATPISTPTPTPRLTDIIERFDGSTDFAEWIKKLELVAKLQGIADLKNFLPLFLTGNAFAVYDALSDKTKDDFNALKSSLLRAFSLDSFSAFDRLLSRRYVHGESVDVYLSDLRRLFGLIGTVDDMLKCAFVSGLPEDVQLQLKAASALDAMSLEQVAERARTINFREREIGAAAQSRQRKDPGREERSCYRCGERGHLARSCTTRRTRGCCFLCGDDGHFAAQCPKKSGPKND